MERETKKSKKSKKNDEDFDFEVLNSSEDVFELLKKHPDQREIILKGAMERFEKLFKTTLTTAQLTEVSEVVSIDHMVNTAGEFERIVGSVDQFLCLLKSFETKTESLMKALFGDFSRLVKKNADLIYLLEGIPEVWKHETLIFVGKNEEHFKRLLVVNGEFAEMFTCISDADEMKRFQNAVGWNRLDLSDIKRISEKFPYLQHILFRKYMSDMSVNASQECVYKLLKSGMDFVRLAESFPDYLNELWACLTKHFIQIVKTSADLVDIARVVPEKADLLYLEVCKRELFEKLIMSYHIPKSYTYSNEEINSLHFLLDCFPENSSEIMEKLFRREKKYKLKSTQELLEICSRFPDYSEELVTSVVNDKKEFKYLGAIPSDVINVMKCVSVEFGNRVLEESLFEKISVNSLIATRMEFPEYEVISKLLLEENKFVTKISEYNQFRDVLTHFSNCEKELISLVLQNDKALSRVFGNGLDLIDYGKRFPEYSNLVMERVLARRDVFETAVLNYGSLDEILSTFKSHGEQIMEKAFRRDKKYRLRSSDDCLKVIRRFPEYSEDLVCIIASPEQFYRIVCSIEDVERLTKAFPKHNERVVEGLLSSVQSFEKVVGGNIMKLLECFSIEHTPKIIRFVIENCLLILSNRERYAKDSRYVRDSNIYKLVEKYPEYEDEICLKILKEGTMVGDLLFFDWVTSENRSIYHNGVGAVGLMLAENEGGFSQLAKRVLWNNNNEALRYFQFQFDKFRSAKIDKKSVAVVSLTRHFGNVSVVLLECFGKLTKYPPKEVVLMIMKQIIPKEIEKEAMDKIKDSVYK